MTMRPINCVLTAIAVFVGGLATFGSGEGIIGEISFEDFLMLLIGAISATSIAAAGYVVNDLFDLPIDEINAPHRPIPSGKVSIESAKLATIILFFVGVGLAILTLNLLAILIAMFGAFGSYRYSTDLKRTGFGGNIMVALLGLFLFIYGGVLVQNYHSVLFPSLFAFFLLLSREIVKGVEDVPGDAPHGINTLAVKIGVGKASWIAVAMLAIVMALTLIPYMLEIYTSPIYIVFLVIEYIMIGTSSFFLLWKREDEEKIFYATYSKKILKMTMFFGVIGFFFSALVPII